MASTSTASQQQPGLANKLQGNFEADQAEAKNSLPPMGPASTLGSSDHTQATRTSSHQAEKKGGPSPDLKKVELNGNSFGLIF